jgi:ABC-type nitrate/sulfonate/bicarbonate transport system ATPase subunit
MPAHSHWRFGLSRRLALTVRSYALIDDLGAAVEPRAALCVAASAGRLVRTKKYTRVVFTTNSPELISALGPGVVLFMPSGVVCRNPTLVRRPRVSVRFDTAHDAGELPAHAAAAARTTRRHTLRVEVVQDQRTECVASTFELRFDGTSTVKLCAPPALAPAATWTIGALLGPSGCGKSTHLRAEAAAWPAKHGGGDDAAAAAASVSLPPLADSWTAHESVLSVLCRAARVLDGGDAAQRLSTAQVAARVTAVVARLRAVGLQQSTCVLPYHCLSSGQQELASIAAALAPGDAQPSDAACLVLVCIDEFTSALDAPCAHAAAIGVAAYVRARPWTRVIVAGVRPELTAWLRPDWVFEVLAGVLQPRDAAAAAAPAPEPPAAPPAPDDAAALAALFAPMAVRVVVRACGDAGRQELQAGWRIGAMGV